MTIRTAKALAWTAVALMVFAFVADVLNFR